MRISKFEWNFLRLIIGVSLIVFAVTLDFVGAWHILQGMSFMGGVIFLLLSMMIFGSEAYPLISFKFRIVKKFKWMIFDEKRYEYIPQVFRFKWLIFPQWCAIDQKIHFYDMQNIFGAEMTGSWSEDKVEDSEEEARFAIDAYKKKLKREREKYFKRPDKKTKKIINV